MKKKKMKTKGKLGRGLLSNSITQVIQFTTPNKTPTIILFIARCTRLLDFPAVAPPCTRSTSARGLATGLAFPGRTASDRATRCRRVPKSRPTPSRMSTGINARPFSPFLFRVKRVRARVDCLEDNTER